MNEAKHTKGPWFVSAECKEIVVSEDSVYGVQVADCGQPAGDEYQPPIGEAEANAKFIVRACNSHDDMLAAIEGLRVSDNCWCSTGDGNPHTQECMNMARVIANT